MTSYMPVGVHGLLRDRTGSDLTGTAQRIAAACNANQNPAYSREDFAWSVVQPTNGAFTWNVPDNWVGVAAEAGVRIYPILNKPPTWAVGGANETESWPRAPISGAALSAYATFCGEVAARYGPGGDFWNANPSLPYLPMTEFEIWNEPYKPGSWKSQVDGSQMFSIPADYAAMVTAAAPAIHATAGAKVHVAVDTGTTNTAGGVTASYAKPLLQAVDPVHIDGLSVHLYASFYRPVTYLPVGPRASYDLEWPRSFARTAKIMDFRALLSDLGTPEKPIWVTELGWPTHSAGVTETEQAARIRTWYGFLRANQHLAQASILYTLQTPASLSDQEVDPADPERYFGLIHNDGIGGPSDGVTATAKPAYTAFVAENAIGVPL